MLVFISADFGIRMPDYTNLMRDIGLIPPEYHAHAMAEAIGSYRKQHGRKKGYIASVLEPILSLGKKLAPYVFEGLLSSAAIIGIDGARSDLEGTLLSGATLGFIDGSLDSLLALDTENKLFADYFMPIEDRLKLAKLHEIGKRFYMLEEPIKKTAHRILPIGFFVGMLSVTTHDYSLIGIFAAYFIVRSISGGLGALLAKRKYDNIQLGINRQMRLNDQYHELVNVLYKDSIM